MSSTALTVILYVAAIVQAASFAAVGLLVSTVRALRGDVNALRESYAATRVTLFDETGTGGLHGRVGSLEHEVEDFGRWRAGVDAERRDHERREHERRGSSPRPA
jgi:hypothetical protein